MPLACIFSSGFVARDRKRQHVCAGLGRTPCQPSVFDPSRQTLMKKYRLDPIPDPGSAIDPATAEPLRRTGPPGSNRSTRVTGNNVCKGENKEERSEQKA